MNNDINEKIVHAAPVPPFVRFVASAVPMVFDNSLSYYEALCALWKWMQDNLVDVINHNATVTEHYIEMDEETRQLFIELKSYVDNYFDNLDVQEEINNKLDDMVEAGTLQEIITSYIQANVAWTFDTVADMKLATNLVNGSYARTLGFHTLNDGGGATYRITNAGTANEMDVIAVGSLFANLIIENTMTVNQFGAYGDSTHDDTAAIRAAVNSDASVIQFIKGSTYMVTPYNDVDEHGILIPSNTTVDLCDATIMVITNDRERYKVFSFMNVTNSTLKNGKILGDVSTHTGNTGEWGYGVSIIHSFNILLDNLYITKCWGDGININFKETENFESSDITVTNCICDDNRRQGMSIEAGNNIYVRDSQFINTGQTLQTQPASGVDVEPLVSNTTLKNIVFDNCIFKDNKRAQFVGGGNQANNIIVNNLSFYNCTFESDASSISDYAIIIYQVENSKFIGNTVNTIKRFVIRPTSYYMLNNNKVTAKDVYIDPSYCENSVIEVNDNLFNAPQNIISGIGYLHNFTGTNVVKTNNTIVIEGNTIVVPVGDSTYDTGLIHILQRSGINKAIINDNLLIGGSRGIRVSCSSVIKDNTIIGTKRYGIELSDATISGSTIYHDVENNNFQNCGTESSIIFNIYNHNIVLRNNIYYPIYFNQGIGSTNYTKTKWLTYANPDGYSLSESNTIMTTV